MKGKNEQAYILHRNLHQAHPVIDRGEGIYLYDTEGNRYLDFGSGIGVVNIGYDVSSVIEAMYNQARKIPFVHSAPFSSQPEIELARRVVEMSPLGMSRVFFVSGGSEAVEAAIKLCRQYFVEQGLGGKYRVISRWSSYHGNTLGALPASGRPLAETGVVGEERGKGFLMGVEFVRDPATKMLFPPESGFTGKVVAEALTRKLMVIGGMGGMIDGVAGDHLQITPAFTTTEEQIVAAVDTLQESIRAALKGI